MSLPLATSPYPPNITSAEREALVRAANDWALAHGLAIRPPQSVVSGEVDSDGITAIHVPLTIFPSPFPRGCFDQAREVQKRYNELYAIISMEEAFLFRALTDVMNGDDFIANLWKVHLRVKEEGYAQSLSLGLFRSDYMIHQDDAVTGPKPAIKQVEFNTIASSFGGLSSQTSLLHKFLADTEYHLLHEGIPREELSLPENDSSSNLAAGLWAAVAAYPRDVRQPRRCVLFIVQDGERNIFDQRNLEYRLRTMDPSIAVFRLSFADILRYTTVSDTPKRQLRYRRPGDSSPRFEVAVVYFRSGYGPSDYPDKFAWEARYQIERSAAIKCPTILTQLAGTKKVQQLLASPKGTAALILGSAVSEFLDVNPDLRTTFTNIYPMDDSAAGQTARRLALDPETSKAYVLKPQREGGGNNIYRSAIPEFLKSIPESHWSSYILMELINPPPVSNLILRNGKFEQGGVICELGIYGSCLWDQVTGEVKHNREAGYLLRTKGDKSEEGGVAAGFGCMDSCRLV